VSVVSDIAATEKKDFLRVRLQRSKFARNMHVFTARRYA